MRAFQHLWVYLATSTANGLTDDVLAGMRADGHECYDFRASGRGPTKIFDPAREVWTPEAYIEALTSPIACQQFNADCHALCAADCVVLLLPCGNDAHAEAGFAHGKNIPVITYLGEGFRPGLMHQFFGNFVTDIPGLLFALSQVVPRDAVATGDIMDSALNPFPLPSSKWA
jgi:hypothetical protein